MTDAFYFIAVIVLSFVSAFLIYSHFQRKKVRDDELSERFSKQFTRGRYFNSQALISAYDRYCERGMVFTSKPRRLGLRLGVILRRFRHLIRGNSMIMGAVIPAVLMYVNVLMVHNGMILNPYVATVLVSVEIIYAGVLYVRSLSIYDSWHREYRSWDMSAIEASYMYGVMLSFRENFVIVSPSYIHILDGEQFHTFPREYIRRLRCIARRVKYYHESRREGRRERRLSYFSDEYSFRIEFIPASGVAYKVELNQFQVKMLIDKYFSELKDDIEMSYEETVHRFGLIIPAEARENRIILESK